MVEYISQDASHQPQLCHPEDKVGRREPHLPSENVLLGNHRAPAAVPGHTQVRPRQPALRQLPKHNTVVCLVFLCVIEEAVSPIMTSSACIRGAATATRVRCSAAVASRGTPRCCCRGEDVDIFRNQVFFFTQKDQTCGKQEMMKIFISKICKYKRGQKYENINIFFFPFCKKKPKKKPLEMLRHAEPDL